MVSLRRFGLAERGGNTTECGEQQKGEWSTSRYLCCKTQDEASCLPIETDQMSRLGPLGLPGHRTSRQQAGTGVAITATPSLKCDPCSPLSHPDRGGILSLCLGGELPRISLWFVNPTDQGYSTSGGSYFRATFSYLVKRGADT